MSDTIGIDHENSERNTGANPAWIGGNAPTRPVTELFGKGKSNVAGASSKSGKTVDPRYVWSAERRAKQTATFARRRAEKAGNAADQETILDLKGPPEPEQPA